MAEDTMTVEVYRVERMNSSPSGNPRYKLFTDCGIFATQTDSAVGYDVDNYSRRMPATFTLWVTKALQVYRMEPTS